MNYIEQIKGFWRSHEEQAYTVNEIALYFHLLEVNNETIVLRWLRFIQGARWASLEKMEI